MIHPRLSGKFLKSSDFCEVGRFTYGEPKFLQFLSGEKVSIGSFCSIADGVTFISGGEHGTRRGTTYPLNLFFCGDELPWHESSRGQIVVGHDVWIGYGAIILSGARIGNGAVVGAGAVVRGEVPEYGIVAGNPARQVGSKRNPGVAWWEWPIEQIRDAAPELLQEVD